MPLIDDVWLWVLTKDEDDAGTGNRLNLTVNNDGIDVFEADFPIGHDRGIRRGEAGFQQGAALPPFETTGLTNSSIRLGIRGDDAWAPRHVLVIAHTQPAFDPGRHLALAIETDLTAWLSAAGSEGHLTTRLRLAGAGSPSTVIRRLLLLFFTKRQDNAETDNDIQLQVAAGGGIVLSRTIEGGFDRQGGRGYWSFLDVDTPFTRSDIAANGITLSIHGADAWLPGGLFLFGLDTDASRPSEMVTLVALPVWDLGWLSTDPQEGQPSIPLPLSI
jgi:hypothetical protein